MQGKRRATDHEDPRKTLHLSMSLLMRAATSDGPPLRRAVTACLFNPVIARAVAAGLKEHHLHKLEH